jgi:thiol-disulfide isomerase/thioredoxin
MRLLDGRRCTALLVLVLAAGSQLVLAQASSTASFAPLEQWKSAVISGNGSQLKSLYSTTPPTRVMTITSESTADAEVAFWTGLKARRIKLNMVQSNSPQPGTQQVVFEAEVHSGTAAKDQVVYVTEGQLWQDQNGTWKLLVTKRSDASKLEQPTRTDNVIYTPGLNAHDEIKQALAKAAQQHRNVLVVFGADWCYDCHVLDLAFHRPDISAVLNRNYEVVHIDVGEGEKNQDIMQQYNVPMKRGIPAIAVLDSHGKLLYSQQGGEFEKARALAPQDVLAFLNKWKPAA